MYSCWISWDSCKSDAGFGGGLAIGDPDARHVGYVYATLRAAQNIACQRGKPLCNPDAGCGLRPPHRCHCRRQLVLHGMRPRYQDNADGICPANMSRGKVVRLLDGASRVSQSFNCSAAGTHSCSTMNAQEACNRMAVMRESSWPYRVESASAWRVRRVAPSHVSRGRTRVAFDDRPYVFRHVKSGDHTVGFPAPPALHAVDPLEAEGVAANNRPPYMH
jgi:hypothetical protein